MPDSTSSSRTCSNCGAPVAAAAPEGLCPRCVAALNLGADTAFTEGSAIPMSSPKPEELAPHFPQLEIIECLGRGGMGVVYKARQTSLGRLVALKLLAPERVGDAKFSERFAQEAKALAALNHPNIVTIHDFGQAGGFFYLLMEFVDGVNLRQAMQVGRFTPEQALAIVPPVCEALQYAHEHGIVHRDIKPENLLLDKDGRVKIADFGVAKMLHADDPNVSVAESQPAGTPQYMAPEQKDHRRTDHRADIYSLGVVLYELLTGELPADKLQPPSRKVQIDVRLDEIVLRALETKPELRYQTAAEFRTQVEAAAAIPESSRQEQERTSSASASRDRRLLLMGCGPALILALLVMTLPQRQNVPAAAWIFAAINGLLAVAFLTPLVLGRFSGGGGRRSVPATASSIALALLLLLLGIVIPVVGVRLHNDSVRSASDEYMKNIRSLQSGVMSLSTQIGEANAGAGRAASRAGNSEEREETRAQAREERLMYEKRSASLQADLNRLQAALVVAGNQQVDAHPWRAVSLVATGLLLALIGGGMLMHVRRRSVAGGPIASGGPVTGGSALGTTAAALGIVWWFAACQLIATCLGAIRIGSAGILATTLMVLALPFVAMLARRNAENWRSVPGAWNGARWLRAFSWLGGLLAVVAIGFALFFLDSLMSETGSWNPAIAEALVVPLTFLGAVLLPWAAAHLWRAARWKAGAVFPPQVPPGRAPFKNAGLLVLLMPVLLVTLLFVKFAREAGSPSGVTSFHIEPVDVRENVVLVDVTTVVARGNAELRSMLNGSRLPAATEAALQETSFAPFAVVLIKPTPNDGNPAWRLLPPGRQMCRLGFALPDAALAKEAFANLHPVGPQSAKSDLTFAGTLFEVSQPGGETYRASLEVGLPLSSGDPRWVEVIGNSQQDASTVTLSWEVFASQPGLAQFSRAGSPIMVLKRQPQTELYSVTAGLELTRLDADRVLFVRRIGYHTLREELSGNFRDLADELLRTKTTSAKTACGTTIELCQFQGKPFTVQVQTHASPLMNGSRAGGIGIGTVGAAAALLLIVAIAAIVVLARKGGTAGKIVLRVVGALLLLLVISCAVIFGVRSLSRDSEQAATVVQMPRSGQSNDDPGAVPLEKPLPAALVPEHIDFKVLRVENPAGTRDILLHFERDANYGLAIEVWQDVTASPDGKVPKEGHRTWQQKTWVGLNGGRVLGWTLPQEFTEAEASALATEMERKWKGSHPLPDGAVPEFATALHRDGWKYHLVTKVLREPGSPRPPAPAGALFTAEQRFSVLGDALVGVRLDQSSKDGPKTELGESLVFKTVANRVTGFVLRWHAYPAQQGKFGNQWILDLVDPDTGVIFHRIENRFATPVKLTSPDVSPLPKAGEAMRLGDTTMSASFQLLRAEEQTAPDAALTAWWDVFATVGIVNGGNEQAVPAFQMALKP